MWVLLIHYIQPKNFDTIKLHPLTQTRAIIISFPDKLLTTS